MDPVRGPPRHTRAEAPPPPCGGLKRRPITFWKVGVNVAYKIGAILTGATPLVRMGYPNIQHSHPSCALWLFCALRSQISHDVTQIKHNSGFFGLELSISCLHSYHSSRASARRSCWCVAVPFLLADLAFFFFLFLPLRPPWDLAFMMPQRLSVDLAFMMPQRLPVDLAFIHDASAPFCRLGFHVRLDCFGHSRLLLVQLLLVHSSTLPLRSGCCRTFSCLEFLGGLIS